LFFNGRMVGGCAGMVYKRSKMLEVADYLRLDHPAYVAHQRSDEGEIGLQFDPYMAHLCNTGVFRCALIPVVAEIPGQSSNVDWCSAKCADKTKANEEMCLMCT
jgi:hypothetical protein